MTELTRIYVAESGEIPTGTCKRVEADGIGIALCRAGSTLFAVDNTCPHAGGPLAEGRLDGDILVCPWHGWRYDLRTGQRPENPEIAVETFRVEERDGRVTVLMPPRRSA